MRGQTSQTLWEKVLELARRQHGAVARRQLLALGFSAKAIERALQAGRLHRTEWRGVYVVGRPELTRFGRLRAALLTCGDDAVLVGDTAGGLWRIWKPRDREIHLSLPAVQQRRTRNGIVVHRRALRRKDITRERGIPVTTPLRTMIDLAARATRDEAERLINAADARNLLRADTLRERLSDHRGEPGTKLLVEVLDRDTFVLTHSELERLFLPLAEAAGIGKPESQRRFGPYRVDFWFPEANLVVECDSLRYHRTTLQQRRDTERDHMHLLAGRKRLRLLHHQIKHEPDRVIELLRLQAATPSTLAASSG
jgi:very-short-patch-repair endonuclease